MIKDRIIQVIEYKDIGKEDFYKKIGMTSASFRGNAKKSPLNSNAIENILSEIPDINPEWLLTGKGAMLVRENSNLAQGPLEGFPLVSPRAVAGFSNVDFRIEEQDIQARYVVPKFKHKQVDFMIEVEGSSMYPKYNSGDVIACKIINERHFIQWNKTHVVATKDQGIIVKRIKPSERENCLCMVSDNKDYPAFDVPMDEIGGVALVVGVIRLE